jgi:signal transduction histidine kinase
MWRAAVVYRVVTAVLSAYLIVRWRHLYAEPGVAFAVGGVLLAVTAAVVIAGWSGRANRVGFVAADLVITMALTLFTRLAQHPRQFHGGMPTLTTIWAAGPVIEVGLVLGSVAGVVAAVLQFGASVIVREGQDGRTLLNGLVLVLVGGIAGYLVTLGVRAEVQRSMLAAERARADERDQLTRSIHDGVLQVLGLVHRRGLAAGDDWTELALEAATQEAKLRALITSTAIEPAAAGLRNLAADLTTLRSERVIVSVADATVLLPAHTADELLAVVRAALHNVDEHAGAGATAWILIEELSDRLVLTVRDDGVGVAAGRLEEAVAQGRLGVAQSIRGRVGDLGGTVTITSHPGEGTEVEIVVPRPSSTDSRS